MKIYEVTMPIAGAICITVEAQSKDEALGKSDEIIGDLDWGEMITGDSKNVELLELNAYDKITEGNILVKPLQDYLHLFT